MKEGNWLVCFRYTTRILGFNASPFILNFIIKHHARTFPADNCTDMLKKNFYVDNLIKSGNSVEMLSDLYTTANYHMEKGHFNLRLRNTNCEELKTLNDKDQKFFEYGCQLKKVLGYKYSTLEDTSDFRVTYWWVC